MWVSGPTKNWQTFNLWWKYNQKKLQRKATGTSFKSVISPVVLQVKEEEGAYAGLSLQQEVIYVTRLQPAFKDLRSAELVKSRTKSRLKI